MDRAGTLMVTTRGRPFRWCPRAAGWPLVAGILAALVTAPAEAQLGEEVRRGGAGQPNIVVILADDMGYGDPGAYNPDSRIPTPNIDRLAAEGMRFTDAHSPSAVCTPTRYGLLTGRYAWRTHLKMGVTWGYSPSLMDPERTTIASLLRENGYATAAIGKWHLGLGDADSTDYGGLLRPGPNAVGFDYFFGIPASLDMDPYVYVENERVLAEPTEMIERSEHRRRGGDGFWREGLAAPGFEHIEVLPGTARRAVSWIHDRASDGSGTPFFLYFPLSAPHAPWLPTAEFDGASGAWYYGDFAAQVDHVVGQVLDALDETGQRDNTLVLFTSDNGAHWLPEQIEEFGHRANGIWRGQKADIWEGGHRVPFVVRWPGVVRESSVSDQVVSLTDLLATFAGVLDVTVAADAGEDSYSILPALLEEDPSGPIREAIVHHSQDGMFAIREGRWKLILGLGSGGFSDPKRLQPEPGAPEWQLYDLERDPRELTNVFDEHPEVVGRLATLLLRYREQGHSRPAATHDPVSLTHPSSR